MTCPNCVTGTIHSGTPKGTEIKIAGFNAYATGDESSNRVIFIGVDIFGWKFVNTRLLADEYASHGFRVIMPDLFNGACLSHSLALRHCARARAMSHPRVYAQCAAR